MGIRNYLVEGVSGTGKTSVCHELRRRGYQAVNGDNELAYRGDPVTLRPMAGDDSWTPAQVHEHHLWDVGRVRALVADQQQALTFCCGGSRNHGAFVDLFDGVFVLCLDVDTLRRRLDARPVDEFGGRPAERELILRLHRTGEDLPAGTVIDAAAPVAQVVDEILRRVLT